MSAWPAFAWECPTRIVDGVECSADREYLIANCGPPPVTRSPIVPTGEYLTPLEVAAVLAVGRTMAYEIAARIGVRVGRSVRVARKALDAYLLEQCASTGAERPTGRSFTASASRSGPKTAKPPSAHSVKRNGGQLIRHIAPRTRPRSV